MQNPVTPTNLEAAPLHRALRPLTFYVIVLLVFVTDQISKAWIEKHLFMEESRPILGNAFLLTRTHNTGGAWGLMPHGNGLFVVFALAAIVALVIAYHRLRRVDLLVGAACALALGGALGNLLDRLRYNHVVDFFEARIIHWPIFNIADSAISLAIVLLLIHFARSARDEAREEKRSRAAASTAGETSASSPQGQGSES